MFFSHSAVCEIKNGYEHEIHDARESLKGMTIMLHERRDWSSAERKKLTTKITYLQHFIMYHELTESLLDQFKTIAPEVYHEIDTIRDKKGRSVDVYVKFVPNETTNVSAWGATYVDQVPGDADAYQSSYGPLTVSVKIWIVNKALLVLAHELGHVKYLVPNLASYVVYHRRQYPSLNTVGTTGHDPSDRSGRSAVQFEKMFNRSYVQCSKASNKRFQNPVTLLSRIRKNSNSSI